MQNYSPSPFGERGVSPFAYWLGLTLKYFLDFPEVFPIAETGSFCYFSHGIFPFFQ